MPMSTGSLNLSSFIKGWIYYFKAFLIVLELFIRDLEGFVYLPCGGW
jgi:hypothetical protein